MLEGAPKLDTVVRECFSTLLPCFTNETKLPLISFSHSWNHFRQRNYKIGDPYPLIFLSSPSLRFVFSINYFFSNNYSQLPLSMEQNVVKESCYRYLQFLATIEATLLHRRATFSSLHIRFLFLVPLLFFKLNSYTNKLRN